MRKDNTEFAQTLDVLSKKDNIIPAAVIEWLVKRYGQILEPIRQESINKKIGLDYGKPFDDVLLNSILNSVQARNKKINVHSLIIDLHSLFIKKTFDDFGSAKRLMQQLNSFNIVVPALIKFCFEEVEMRNKIIKSYVEKKHAWADSKIATWIDELRQELITYSNNTIGSKKEYLNNKYSEAVNEAKRIQKDVKEKYGYFIECFFNASEFIATEEDLNSFFSYSETRTGGYLEFHNLFLLFSKYIDEHNKISLLKNIINNNYQLCEKEEHKYTHREFIIAHNFKVDNNLAEFKPAKKWKEERGNGCYNEFYTLLRRKTDNKSNPYKAPTKKELKNVIELLADFPELQKKIKSQIENL